jgi:2-polyprenyl-3-methyl-5-hydroxy-6-metoxy-1,4-benzoquinol methylase
MITLKKYDDRIPAWNSTSLVNRNCPFCGCINYKKLYIRPDQLNVVLCDACDTHYVSPAPSEEALDYFYKSYYGDHAINLETNKNYYKNICASNVFNDVRICVLATMLDISKSQVLDVGCGNGQFLLNLKYLGASITGIDLSQDAVNAAQFNGIERAFKIAFSDFNDGIKYDIIIFNDVIEHPLEPIKLIQKAVTLLKTGGLILIWTPNNDNIFVDNEKKTLRVDLEHMQYLGSKACKFLSVINKLDLVHYESLGYCTYSQHGKIKFAKNALIRLLKIFLIYKLVKKFYLLLKFKSDRVGNYHLFAIFKKCD